MKAIPLSIMQAMNSIDNLSGGNYILLSDLLIQHDDSTMNIALLLWQRCTPSLFTFPSFDQGPATQSTAVSHPQNGLKHAPQH